MASRTITMLFGSLGVVLPLLFMVVDAASPHGWWPEWILYAWPTSYMLGAAFGPKDAGAYAIIAAAIALNGLLYGYIANVATRFARATSGKDRGPVGLPRRDLLYRKNTLVDYKIPKSALVIIHTPDLQVLMMERASWLGFWQSVTGGLDREDESFREAAIREVREETGLDATRYRLDDWGIEREFEIFPKHRHRYAPGVTRNLEHVFSLEVPAPVDVRLDPSEHLRYQWLPYKDAAALTISWSNRDAILALPERRVRAQ